MFLLSHHIKNERLRLGKKNKQIGRINELYIHWTSALPLCS
jgi:hypothetical protein